MGRAGCIALALLLAGACAFGSDKMLFGAGDSVQPFADGARFTWSASGGERFDAEFRLETDGHYTIAPLNGEAPLSGVLFVAIGSTPEEDYVAQLRLSSDSEGVIFAFLWRTPTGYRAVLDPGRLIPDDDLAAADPYCTWQTYQSCGIARREDVFAVYCALIYDRFVLGGVEPVSYIDLLLPDADGAPKRRGGL